MHVCMFFLSVGLVLISLFKWCFDIFRHVISSFQPMEIYVDDEAKLTLHGLVQVHLIHYC